MRTFVLCYGLAAMLAGAACSEPEPPAFLPPSAAGPFWLSATGLYRDMTRKQVAKDVLAFEPAFALWTDGATKRRWLRLPRRTKIDTRDVDHWQFPEGAVFWKEFSRDGRRLETRVIARLGDDPRATWIGAFVWNADESDARWTPAGEENVQGTTHDVPSEKQCGTCHGEPARVLGFSAVQQPRVDTHLLSDPPERAFTPPGDAVTSAALGYLHANCGHCHNPSGSARPDTDMDLQLSAAEPSVAAANAVRTTLGRPLQSFMNRGPMLRVMPRNPAASALLARMRSAEREVRMPPLGSEEVDPRGVETIRAWIETLQ